MPISSQVTWQEFKEIAARDIEKSGALVYRGQLDPSWRLTSTVHRTSIIRTTDDVAGYTNYILPSVHDQIEAWVGRSWDLRSNFGLAEFLAYLQHNGFPTPLLDWSFSPYIAAYFAFEAVNHFRPQCRTVAIYSFDQLAWSNTFKQIYDVAHPEPHVSVLRPRIVGNHKLALQQGCFTWSNIPDIEAHIEAHEVDGRQFLVKYELPVAQRSQVMRELALMGISALQLMPSVESVCKRAFEDLVTQHPPELPS